MGAPQIAILNFFLSLLVLSFLYFKRHWHPVIILLILSLLPLLSLLRPGVYQSGDMQIHATKTIEFASSLSEGHLIPRWSGNLNATYGYPLWEFTYATPYYLTSFFYLSGVPAVTSVKLFLVITYLLSGIGMFLAAKRHLPPYAALLAAVFYQFAPYHLIDLHYRVAAGELAALMILPFCFYYLNSRKLLPASLCIALLVLSHPAISLLSLPLLILYSINFITPLISGLGLSAFYWLPVIFESQYTLRSVTPFTIAFPHLKDLFFSPWQFGLVFQGPMGQLSSSLGILHWLVLILAIYLALRTKSKFLLLSLLILSIYFIATIPISAPFWHAFPFLQNIQFSYRLLGLLMLISSFIAGQVVSYLPQKSALIYLLLSLVVIASSANWANRKILPYVNDRFLAQNLPYLTATPGMSEGIEAAPRWVDPAHPWHSQIPSTHLEITQGQSTITPISYSSTNHSYDITVYSRSNFRENTTYFPGWRLLINNVPAAFTYPNGLITFTLPPGIYQVDLIFQNTLVRSLSLLFSLFTLIMLLFYRLKTSILTYHPHLLHQHHL
jgi:hypothetical protein